MDFLAIGKPNAPRTYLANETTIFFYPESR